MDDREFRKQIQAMFKNVENKEKNTKKRQQGELIAENFHSYFATFRKHGHSTIRFFQLGKGSHGVGIARLFLEVANPACNYLMIYRIDGVSGEVTAFDPTKK